MIGQNLNVAVNASYYQFTITRLTLEMDLIVISRIHKILLWQNFFLARKQI
jgi:hypothetical protein